MDRTFVIVAAAMGFAGILAGTFGAHILKDVMDLDERWLTPFEVGVRYHFYHVFAIMGSAWVVHTYGGKLAVWSGWLFLAGTIVFSGALYLLGLLQITKFGMVAPIGGLLLMGGWACLGLSVMSEGKTMTPAERVE